MRKARILMATLLAAVCAQAGAQQQVWRCGNSYSARPCDGGAALAIDERKPDRDAAEAARAAARRDAKLADAMEKDRLAREKQAPRAVIFRSTRMADDPPAAAGKSTKKGKGKGKQANDDFTVMVPKKPGTKATKPGKS
jgi:hypothetical protein